MMPTAGLKFGFAISPVRESTHSLLRPEEPGKTLRPKNVSLFQSYNKVIAQPYLSPKCSLIRHFFYFMSNLNYFTLYIQPILLIQ